MHLDFREALNTISDVVQNRPPPLREFDQIYMKVGDLVIQADFVARRFNGLDVIFVGDGDAVSLSMVHLKAKGVFKCCPSHITVLDFDERIVNSINHFAYNNKMQDLICAKLYNVWNPLPDEFRRKFDAFYTNPPWGASNDGISVTAFIQRGIEAVKSKGCGAIVIADDISVSWTEQVLYKTQQMLVQSGYIVQEMIPGLHQYHLDDAPDLASCCILARDVNSLCRFEKSEQMPAESLPNFYGRYKPLEIEYVRDLSGLNSGKAPDASYRLERLKAP